MRSLLARILYWLVEPELRRRDARTACAQPKDPSDFAEQLNRWREASPPGF